MKKLLLLLVVQIMITCLPTLTQGQESKGKVNPPQQKPDNLLSLEFDLASTINSLTISVKNNTPVELTILNMVPTKKYNLDIVTQIILPPPINFPEQAKSSAVQGCNGYEARFSGVKNEIEFSEILNGAKKDCDSLYKYYLAKSTRAFKLGAFSNEKKIITVTDQENHKWTIIIETEVPGKIVVLYGFSFIPYAISKPRTYYALPLIAPAGSYTIGKGSSESRYEYAPTIAFHYIDKNASNISSSFSLGLGVGFNSSNTVTPVVTAGYSALFYKNYGINIGIAAHSINRLKGKYTEGQVITTNLESADLTEKVIRFNPVIGFTYRFGSWPFAQRNEPGSTTVNP